MRAVHVMIEGAKRIYILIIKVNKFFSFFSALCFLKEQDAYLREPGFFPGISICQRQNFDMMKSQSSFVDCFTASRRFGQKLPELLPES